MALIDPESNVLTMTTDQTGTTYVTAKTFLKNAVINAPYVIPQTGLYYVVLSISASAKRPPMSGSWRGPSGFTPFRAA